MAKAVIWAILKIFLYSPYYHYVLYLEISVDVLNKMVEVSRVQSRRNSTETGYVYSEVDSV